MFDVIMAFCRSIYVKKVMKLLAFIFEQPSYFVSNASFAILMGKRVWLICFVCLPGFS